MEPRGERRRGEASDPAPPSPLAMVLRRRVGLVGSGLRGLGPHGIRAAESAIRGFVWLLCENIAYITAIL